jgi:SAM-dependent methyltransferase
MAVENHRELYVCEGEEMKGINTAEYWDAVWNKHHWKNRTVKLSPEEEELITAVNFMGPVLGLGMGDGKWLILVSVPSNAYNLDISPVAIDMCKKIGVNGKVFEMKEGNPFPLPNESMAVVVALNSLEHLPKKDSIYVLKECKRVLKPFGKMIIEWPDPSFKCSEHEYEIPEEDVADMFKDWNIVKLDHRGSVWYIQLMKGGDLLWTQQS